MEHRHPRSHFTRALEKICLRLDDAGAAPVQWKNRFLHRIHAPIVTVSNVWVVGSYARGALTCGDLDLVVDATAVLNGSPTQLPPTSAISRVLFKSPRDVRISIGTPHQNTSGVPFPDAHLIWQAAPIKDWHSAIDAIRPDPNAGRLSRPTDLIPLRREQIDCYDDQLEELIALKSTGILDWEFIPVTDAAMPESVTEDETDFIRTTKLFCGQKTQKLLPHLLTLFRNRKIKSQEKWQRSYDKMKFRNGGCDIFIYWQAMHPDRTLE
ncbi:hypothetical protein [Andreprevotia chitinilytica]|uniref:hypothetical protein n=1 Tax=Andreprevotia chitinilytica TaxID=396808 RepID=UPI0012EB68C8|nr:hypothetical protein [Andreprevotia chitinilytica]